MKTCSHCHTEKGESEFRMRRETRGNRGGGKLVYLNNVCKKCDSEIQNKYYFHHKDNTDFIKKWKQKSRNYYHSNKETCVAKAKIYREKSKDKRKAYDAAHKDTIKKQHSIVAKRWAEYQRDNVTDIYCISLIRSQNGGKEKCQNITPEMIEQKRLSILIKRKLYDYQKSKTDTRGSNERIDSVFSGTNRH